jgi:hypothetical protein
LETPEIKAEVVKEVLKTPRYQKEIAELQKAEKKLARALEDFPNPKMKDSLALLDPLLTYAGHYEPKVSLPSELNREIVRRLLKNHAEKLFVELPPDTPQSVTSAWEKMLETEGKGKAKIVFKPASNIAGTEVINMRARRCHK